MTEAMPFLQKYDITFLRPPTISAGEFRVWKKIFPLHACFPNLLNVWALKRLRGGRSFSPVRLIGSTAARFSASETVSGSTDEKRDSSFFTKF